MVVRIFFGWEFECGLVIWLNISLSSLVCVDVVIVFNVEYGVFEYE